MSQHEPVQPEAVAAEWRIFKDALKTSFAGIAAKKDALIYQKNISKAQLVGNALNHIWKEIVR